MFSFPKGFLSEPGLHISGKIFELNSFHQYLGCEGERQVVCKMKVFLSHYGMLGRPLIPTCGFGYLESEDHTEIPGLYCLI
jgi:hypothetical protein